MSGTSEAPSNPPDLDSKFSVVCYSQISRLGSAVWLYSGASAESKLSSRNFNMASQSECQGLLPEIIFDILSRLSVKVLSRFRCVCKTWCSLNSHPLFQQHHYSHSKNDPRFLEIYRDFEYDVLAFSTYTCIHEGTLVNKFCINPAPSNTIDSIGSCEGIVCLVLSNSQIILCNPSTKELVFLPRHASYPDPFSYCVGVGYAASLTEPKVVRFILRGTSYTCEVFNFATGDWREARSSLPPQYPGMDNMIAPFIHGALHLTPRVLPENNTSSIAVFDIDKEECRRMIPLPEGYYNDTPQKFRDLKELGGSLFLAYTFDNHMELWLLKDYNQGEWVKEYTIKNPSFVYRFDPLAIVGDGNIMLRVYNSSGLVERIYFYNPQNKAFKKKTRQSCIGTIYVESFSSLESSFIEEKNNVWNKQNRHGERQLDLAKFGSVFQWGGEDF